MCNKGPETVFCIVPDYWSVEKEQHVEKLQATVKCHFYYFKQL